MADETYEIAVQLTGEGIEDTTSDLEGVEDEFEDTSESVGESAEDLEGFSRQWQGAMTAVTVALATATAGLLSNVPVVSEAWSGLSAVLSAVAFAMDSVLRPVFGPLNTFLFMLAGAIFEAEGAWRALIGVLAIAASAIVAVLGWIVATQGPMAAVAAITSTLAGLWGALTSVAAAVGGAIAALAATLGVSFAAAAALVIGAVLSVVAIAWMLWHNWDTVSGFLAGAWDWLSGLAVAAFFAIVGGGAALLAWLAGLPGDVGRLLAHVGAWFLDLVTDAASWGADVASDWWSKAKDAFPSRSEIGTAFSSIVTWFTGLPSRAKTWGGDVIDFFVQGAKDLWPGWDAIIPSKPGFLNPKPLDWGERTIELFHEGAVRMSDRVIGPGMFGLDTRAGATGSVSGTGGGRQHAFGGQRQEIVVQLNGRELTRFVSDDQKRGFDDRGRSP